MKTLPILLVALTITACGTDQKGRNSYLVEHEKSEQARWAAVKEIGTKTDSPIVQAVLGTMAAMPNSSSSVVPAEKSDAELWLMGLGILAPTATSIANIVVNKQISNHASDNALQGTLSMNKAFTDIANKPVPLAFTPATVSPNITNITKTDNHSITGSYGQATSNTTTGAVSTTSTTGSYNPAPVTTNTTTANPITLPVSTGK